MPQMMMDWLMLMACIVGYYYLGKFVSFDDTEPPEPSTSWRFAIIMAALTFLLVKVGRLA